MHKKKKPQKLFSTFGAIFTSLHDYVLVKANNPWVSLQNNQLSYTLHGDYI